MDLPFSTMRITVTISPKPVVAEREYVDTFYSYTGFNPNLPTNIENTSGNYVISFSTLWLSVSPFSRKLRLIHKIF